MSAHLHMVQRFQSTGIDRRRLLMAAGGGAGLLLLRRGGVAAQDSGKQLVIGANFVIQSLDPGRSIETTTNMINHAAYDALVTFDGEDLSHPKPLLATKWTISEDGTTYTFTLRPDVKFVSGNPLTSADVKWSFERVIDLQSNPAFLVEKIASVDAPDPQTVVLKLSSPYPAILPILSSPSLGVVDSKLVAQHGGKSGSDAKDADTAEPFLNSQSAGSGSYTLSSYVPDQEVVLVKNPNYWRGAPAFDRIVIRNITEAATQKLQLESGDLDIATGLSQDQIAGMQSADVTTKASPAATTFYVLMNDNKEIGGPFANPLIQQAVRAALKYDEIMALVGGGAVRLAGIIPTNFPGSLPSSDAPKTDQAKARSLIDQAALGAISGALSYTADSTIWGVQMNILAQKVQSDLGEVGMNLTLDGLPSSTALQKYRDGKDQIGVWSWAADYPDASDFLVYLPGRTVGKRAGWPADASPEAAALAKLGDEAETTVDDAKRTALYQQIEHGLQKIGPYAPLVQPAAPYAFRSDLSGVTFNSVWGVDLFAVARSS